MLKSSFKNIDLMQTALGGAWLKNSAISNNIANVNTPGYKRQVVNFESVLQEKVGLSGSVSMKVTNSKHIATAGVTEPQVEMQSDTSYRVDDNNVDVDVENAEMAKNTIYYNTLVNEVNGQFARLKATFKINK